MKKKKYQPPHPNQYIAMDNDLQVFAGYKNGYPCWSNNIDDFKYINDTTHIRTLRDWFPGKRIELMKI